MRKILFILFLGFTLLANGQNAVAVKDTETTVKSYKEIGAYFIKHKKPFYLTSHTKYASSTSHYQFVNGYNYYGEIARKSLGENTDIYPLYFKEYEIGRYGYLENPGGKHYFMVAVSNPRLGDDYKNLSNYSNDEIFYIEFADALKYGEIDSLPYKLTHIKTCLPFYKYLLSIGSNTNELGVDCFRDFLLPTYNWRDSFHKTETLKEWSNIIKENLRFIKKPYFSELDLAGIGLPSLFKDYEVRVSEYNHDNLTFTVEILDPYNWSHIFYNSPFRIETNWSKYKYYNKKLTLSFTKEDAKSIIKLLNGDRQAYMRVNLSPSKDDLNCTCKMNNCNLIFFAETLRISNDNKFNSNNFIDTHY